MLEGLLTSFGPTESVQVYHLLADRTVTEVGTINDEITFQETAVGFVGTAGEKGARLVLAFEPRNLTLSLLPAITPSGAGWDSSRGSSGGRTVSLSPVGGSGDQRSPKPAWDPSIAGDVPQIRWDSPGAIYVSDEIESGQWTTLTYMGSHGGSVLKYVLDFTLEYGRRYRHYQPFSVYRRDSNQVFVAATSCDEFVWSVFEELARLSVTLKPVLSPPKVQIIFYALAEPSVADSVHSGTQLAAVAAHFEEMRRCLRTHPLQRLQTLTDFTGYYSRCLEDVAFVWAGEGRFYRVPLATNIAGDVDQQPAQLPEAQLYRTRFTWVDILILVLLAAGFAVGIFMMLARANLLAHLRFWSRQSTRRKVQYSGISGPTIEPVHQRSRRQSMRDSSEELFCSDLSNDILLLDDFRTL